ncbi:hypothetical protein TSUD_130770 [Trifolium subterraneum]|nr:hypothetical protein TSUD_130770 [Trifolium subterraneum]
MSCFHCCASSHERINKKSLKRSIKQFHNAKTLTSFANINDSGKRRFIEDEIAKLGKGNVTSKIFLYRDLCAVTQNFHPTNMIGEGGFGRVYKGTIKKTNQAQPLLKDRKKFTLMADPLLEDKYPIKSLYQALAVAAIKGKNDDGEKITKESFPSQSESENGNNESNEVKNDDDNDNDEEEEEEDEDDDDDDDDEDNDDDDSDNDKVKITRRHSQ